ncbi:MAG: hypothetical protein VX603_15965, partial [Gemmatimonadota bacterium]|nr:hypothetical protein [Gemmatimonadota bacterium]
MFNRSTWESWRRDLNRRSEHQTFQLNSLLWGGLVVCIGSGIVILLAFFLPVSTDSLEEAKRLGIVSTTILDDFPDDHAAKIYFVSLIFVLPLSFLSWCALAWRSTHFDSPLDGYNQNAASAPKVTTSNVTDLRSLLWFDFLLLPILLVCLIYDGRFFKESKYNIKFISEEGQICDLI